MPVADLIPEPGQDRISTFAFNYNNLNQVFRLRAGPPMDYGGVWTRWYIQNEGSLKPKVLSRNRETNPAGGLKPITGVIKGDWSGDYDCLWEIGSAGPGLWW